jgi:hypothetical protein
MNQIRTPARPDSTRAISDSRRVTIEYDDGDPATIAPRDARPTERTVARRPTTPARCFRAPLAEIERGGGTDYDDGNPATIVTGA